MKQMINDEMQESSEEYESDQNNEEETVQSPFENLPERPSSAGKNKDLKQMYTMKKYLTVKKESSSNNDNAPQSAKKQTSKT